MCTVVFIPKDDKYFFASLRDENPLRAKAIEPSFKLKGYTSFLSPTDALAGGTWLGITHTGKVIILLNGGFIKHEPGGSYTKSRGLIVSELLASDAPIADWKLFKMAGVEPFTLIVWSEGDLYELVWDGKIKYDTRLKSNQPYIWSSSTLYNGEATQYRKKLFQQWIRTQTPVSALSLFNFFESYKNDENGFLMNRNEKIKTLSYSFIELLFNNSAELSYFDFALDLFHYKKFEFSKVNNGHILPTGLSENMQQQIVNSLGILYS